MTSNEQEHHQQLLTSSTTALRSLTISSETADRSVRDATSALTELLSQVTASRQARDELARSERRYKQRNDRALNELQRVEQEIVQAKVGAVELFEERDQVKREMARAKQLLEEIKELERGEAERKEDVAKDEAALEKQEKEVQGLEKKVAETMHAFGGLENGLLTTTDELDTLRKKKEKLRGKMSDTTGEW